MPDPSKITAPGAQRAGNAERIACAANECAEIQYGPVHLSRVLAHEPVGCILQPSVVANVSELPRTNEPLDHMGHVNIQQRCRLPMLELQDRIGNILSDRGDLAMFPRIRWEKPFVFVSIFRDTKERLGTATPHPQWSQEASRSSILAEASWPQLGYIAKKASKNPATAVAVVRWSRTSTMTCWYVLASLERQGKSLPFTVAQCFRSFASLVSLRFSPSVTWSGEVMFLGGKKESETRLWPSC